MRGRKCGGEKRGEMVEVCIHSLFRVRDVYIFTSTYAPPPRNDGVKRRESLFSPPTTSASGIRCDLDCTKSTSHKTVAFDRTRPPTAIKMLSTSRLAAVMVMMMTPPCPLSFRYLRVTVLQRAPPLRLLNNAGGRPAQERIVPSSSTLITINRSARLY